jgi:hypothetical protein
MSWGFAEVTVRKLQLAFTPACAWSALALLAACGPTVVSSEIAASITDPNARIELRTVQPDALDGWTTNELWGVNLSDEPVCGGYREQGLSWSSFLLAPRSERRLLGLGNGDIGGTTRIKAMRNGEGCTDSYVAS